MKMQSLSTNDKRFLTARRLARLSVEQSLRRGTHGPTVEKERNGRTEALKPRAKTVKK